MGLILGAFVAIWLFSKIFEFLIFKRVFDDPVKGKVGSVAFTYLFAVVVAGFGMADGGPPVFMFTSLAYLPAALIVGAFAYRRGVKLRDEQPLDEMTETFS